MQKSAIEKALREMSGHRGAFARFAGDIVDVNRGEDLMEQQMDHRHYAPSGFSTYKFSGPERAVEFVHGWTNAGGAAVLAKDIDHQELYDRDTGAYVVYAGPLNDFYGEDSDTSGEKLAQWSFVKVGDDEKKPEKDAKKDDGKKTDKKDTKKNESCTTPYAWPKKPGKDSRSMPKSDDKGLAFHGTLKDFFGE